METSWRPVLIAETEQPYWKPLQQFVRDERSKYTKSFHRIKTSLPRCI